MNWLCFEVNFRITLPFRLIAFLNFLCAGGDHHISYNRSMFNAILLSDFRRNDNNFCYLRLILKLGFRFIDEIASPIKNIPTGV